MKYLLLLSFFLFSFCAFSQTAFRFDHTKRMTVDGVGLKMPFAGGINAAQLQTMDINGNGLEEFITWDINARMLLVFEKSGESYVANPELAYFFPEDINGFLVLADFDGDGRKDLFTSTPFGIKAYRNTSQAGATRPTWEVSQPFLRMDSGVNIQANNLDIPLLVDLDGDGDLDIVTFNFATGDILQFYRNTSVERKGTPDMDGFASPVIRWGGFEFCDCGSFTFGITCAGVPFGRLEDYEESSRIQHAGGHSMLYEDFNGDGIRDLLLGRDECNTLYYLPNSGNNINPIFETFETALPGLGSLPEFPIFHVASLIDGDLIISSNASAMGSDLNIDFAQTLYQYKGDMGSYTFHSPAFLQQEMLDLGENTRPFYQGNSVSGELMLAANSFLSDTVLGRVYLFELRDGDFELKNQDLLSLSSLALLDIQFQEFQGWNGQIQTLVSGIKFANNIPSRRLFWTRNRDYQNLKEIGTGEMDLGRFDHLEGFNYNSRDYLLQARQSGELILFEVDFSQEPQFQLLERDFLGYSDNPANRNLNVHVIPSEKPDFYSIDLTGRLFLVKNFMDQANKQEVSIQLNSGQNQPARFGRNTWISHIPDVFNQSHDLILGNKAGGLHYLKMAGSGSDLPGGELNVVVYPNPAHESVNIVSNETATGRLVNAMGQVIRENMHFPANTQVRIQTHMISPGLYILQLQDESGKRIAKKIIVRP
ncbi:T9SS type A sorting domain-containing protein [Pararhodonellum marinum]|uniref:T9SS type A sorting domain-containing protein n=1 Tax=Pararhodonellum marinum TaxID=2755358 RepID=UPI00188FE436|nr:T9SS type A sorting domain-containing protein [Pararhodonellum marinum]